MLAGGPHTALSWTPLSGGLKEADQLSADNVRLLLVGPMTGALHQLDSPEFREAALPSAHGPARGSIGAPILSSRDELRRDIDGTAREGELLGQ